MNKKTILWVTVLILIASFCAGCGQTVTTGEIGVVKDEEFGGVYVDLTIAGFNDLGFAFGDSVDIEFDNGLKFQDVPYYSGYYVCTLLLALAEASPREIVDDYMITYDNYYKVTKEKDPEKYEAILGNVYDFLYCLCGAEKGTDLDTLDLSAGAENYLRRGGLSDAQIEIIEAYLCGTMD